MLQGGHVYRRLVITEEVDEVLQSVCLEISHRYEIRFPEIGTEEDHVHFLVQSVPTYSPTKIAVRQKAAVGWRIPDGRVFCIHSGRACE